MESKNDKYFNSARVCRFCLSQAGVMSPIFESREGNNNAPSLPAKIMSFARIQLFANDGLPTILCHRCLYVAETAFDFKTQCETSDAMLREYLTMMHATINRSALKTEPSETNTTVNGETSCSMKPPLQPPPQDMPFKRKRGRPRKEENLIFYSSPVHPSNEQDTANELKVVDGIESLVTVVDPRSDILSNSDEEMKKELAEIVERRQQQDEDTARSLAIARAKAKKYMGLLVGTDDNGVRTRRHLCKGCGKTFGHCSDLRKHVLVHTGERPFHCQICTKTFSRSTNLNKHLKVHSGQKPFTCSKCPKSFASKGDLQRHLVIHSGVKPFSCHLCHQCFSRKDKLTRHVKLHNQRSSTRVNNNTGPSSLMFGLFDDVNEQVMDETHWEDGMEYDHGHIKQDLEDEEDESSEDVNDCEGQEGVEDGDVNVESMVINIDPFPIDNDAQDINGLDDENDENEYIEPPDTYGIEDCGLHCVLCNRMCADLEEMRTHLANHAMERPHKCKLCHKSFTRRRELMRHENVHTGLKPHKCSLCGKAFARKDKLARHVKIHSVEKSHYRKLYCEVCAVGFYKQNLYEEHLITQTHIQNAESFENGNDLSRESVDESDEASDDDAKDVKRKSVKDQTDKPCKKSSPAKVAVIIIHAALSGRNHKICS